jgi:hypothetical protein
METAKQDNPHTQMLLSILIAERQRGADYAFREVLSHVRAVEAGAFGDEPGQVSTHMARVIAQSVRQMVQCAEQAEGLRTLRYAVEKD